jgi:hypothetical protein
VCEYWDATAGHWTLADAQIDDVQRKAFGVGLDVLDAKIAREHTGVDVEDGAAQAGLTEMILSWGCEPSRTLGVTEGHNGILAVHDRRACRHGGAGSRDHREAGRFRAGPRPALRGVIARTRPDGCAPGPRHYRVVESGASQSGRRDASVDVGLSVGHPGDSERRPVNGSFAHG